MIHRRFSAEATRRVIRRCERIWLDPTEHDEADVLEALAILLAAYGFGSRTAEAALHNPSRKLKGWRLPPRRCALDAAADLVRLAEGLRAGSPPAGGLDAA